MAYSDFKNIEEIKQKFDILVNSRGSLFSNIAELQPSQYFIETLTENTELALNINTEKARSEFIIAPVLVEARKLLNRNISLFSGLEFNVDDKLGLVGYCDFILSNSPDQVFLEAPTICIVEAKNENIKSGYAQCAAEMIAAQLFNQRHAKSTAYILGVVTTGSNWKFLKLIDKQLCIDFNEYLITQVNKILGILVNAMQPNSQNR